MKNIQSIILGVLGLAVAVLFFLHFKSSAPSVNLSASSIDIANAGATRVALVNIDSFYSQYKEYKKIKEEIDNSAKASKKSLENESMALQQEYQKLMQQAQAGQFTSQQQAQAKEREIMAKGNSLKQKEEQMMKSLAEKSEKATSDLYKKVEKYFEDHKSKYNCDMVMGYRDKDMLLYVDKKIDITKQLVEDLNNE